MSEFEPVTQTANSPPVSTGALSAYPPPPARRWRAPMFFFGALSGCLMVLAGLVFLAILALAVHSDSGEVAFGEKVAVIPLDGEIRDARETVEAIHKYADNSMVKAIVMRINSPGGAIAPSQEIFETIRKTRQESGKPFVASLGSVAASGGFYVASACDQIIANPGSITGSIGVIMEWTDVHDLLTWAKLKEETITSGSMKAAGSPYRSMNDAERSYFQDIVSQLHLQFVKAVAAGRKGKISESEVARIADGRVFTGEQALGLKLVDGLGNLDDAVSLAAKLARMHGKPGLLYPHKHKPGLFELFSNSDDAESMIERVVSRRTAFLYRW
jgi:protease IV